MDDDRGVADDMMSESAPDYLLVATVTFSADVPKGRIQRRNLGEGIFEGDIEIPANIGIIGSIDQSPDNRYLLIYSEDRANSSAPYVSHLRVVDLGTNDMDFPEVVRDITDNRLAFYSFFINKVNMGIREAEELAETMALSASSTPMVRPTLKSLNDLGITMATGQKLSQSILDTIEENGFEVDQSCSWASLPYRYQFEEGIIYINSSKSSYNFFNYGIHYVFKSVHTIWRICWS